MKAKFRVWDNAFHCWAKQTFMMGDEGDLWMYSRNDNYIPAGEHYIIVFSTGLSDKKGNDIFEGDIVRGPFGSGMGCKSTRYKDFSCAVTISPENGVSMPFHGDYGYRFYPLWNEVEIIGNIHENPELLSNQPPSGEEG